MACTPPQARCPHSPARRHSTDAVGRSLALVAVASWWPVGEAYAARSCEEWSADITTVEGRVEVRRSDNQGWVPLSAGEHVCTGDALRTQSSSRATITLPDGGTLTLDENSALGLPEPVSGLGSLIDLLRGVIHVISRDPRSLLFTTPYANAGLEGTEFDIRVDANERLTEIVVLEGEVVVTTPAGELKVAGDHIAVAKDGEAPTAQPYASPIERMRWASYYPSIIDRPLPGQTKSLTSPSKRTRTFLRGERQRASARHGSKPQRPMSPPPCASPRGTPRPSR